MESRGKLKRRIVELESIIKESENVRELERLKKAEQRSIETIEKQTAAIAELKKALTMKAVSLCSGLCPEFCAVCKHGVAKEMFYSPGEVHYLCDLDVDCVHFEREN